MRSIGVSAAVVLVATLLGTEVQAQWYVSVNGGVFQPSDLKAEENYRRPAGYRRLTDIETDPNAGVMVSGAVGRSMGAFRLEGEVFYGRSDFDASAMLEGQHRVEVSGKAVLFGATFGGWYDFPLKSGLTPYVGGGLGLYRSKSKSEGGGDVVNDGPLWRVGAGIVFDVNDTVAIDAGWRLMRAFSRVEDRVAGIDYDKPLEMHIFTLGLRYSL